MGEIKILAYRNFIFFKKTGWSGAIISWIIGIISVL